LTAGVGRERLQVSGLHRFLYLLARKKGYDIGIAPETVDLSVQPRPCLAVKRRVGAVLWPG